jgi:DoxX-like family
MTSATQSTILPHITNQTASCSKKSRWTGRILSTVTILFMLLDSLQHLIMPTPVADAFARLGYPVSLGFGIGILGLICTALYAVPRTSILGAILLTGFLGGAAAANLRVADPLFETLFPVLFGAMIWTGIILRNDLLRRLVPFRA